MATKTLLWALGEEIRIRRTRLGISQEALAHEAGLHRNVIGRLERGKYNTTLLSLESITAELDVSMSELLAAAEKRLR